MQEDVLQHLAGADLEDPAAKRMRLDMAGPISEIDILRLVAQRESARQVQRFAEADAIREELRSMGVELYDKEKEWRSRDGRRGPLFTAGPGECLLSDMEIQERINEREDARKTKDFARADEVRDQLRAQGVELDDKAKVWRTAIGRTGNYNGTPTLGGAGAFGGMPVAALGGGIPGMIDGGVPVMGAIDNTSIEQLMAEQDRLIAAHDFEGADQLQNHLMTIGTEDPAAAVANQLNEALTGMNPTINATLGQPNLMLSNDTIQALVEGREAALEGNDPVSADAIREDLRIHGIDIWDKQRCWRASDGRSGQIQGRVAGIM